jgi:NADPH-dependent glutamate synthase beta subunit-like oxidoreductase
MRKFRYVRGITLKQAVAELGETAKVIAGGTDLVGVMKDEIHPTYPETLVDIKSIPGLDYIKEENGILKIGALTRLADIAENDTVKNNYEALAKVAMKVATPQIREMGTIGGNLCQEVRCWYYRNPDNRFNCLRKGGATCNALTGDAQHHSIFGSIRFCLTPCSAECPAHIDIPDYMDMIREGDIAGAARIILESNPIPAITGRVCPHYCETKCNRVGYDESVSVRCIERYVGDYILDNPGLMGKPARTMSKKKVAIIGSGPAGLSAAYYLNGLGYNVTVFEKMPKAGGLLTYGIPPYRLPKKVVDKQIKVLGDAGISFNTGARINVNVLAKGYDAVFLACGAWRERSSGIKGEQYLMSGMEFLRETNSGERKVPGKKVAVIGGGNVALDVARTLLRLGAEPVVLYRRGKEEMPALKEEVERAEEEGIEFRFLTAPVEASRKNGGVELKCIKNRLGAQDESGRPRPEPIQGSEHTILLDAVMEALGEEPDLSFVPKAYLDTMGRLKVDEASCLGGNVFAGGDFVSGPSTVIEAITSGRKAAGNIDIFLGGKKKREIKKVGWKALDKFNSDYLGKTTRVVTTELSVNERVSILDGEDVGSLEQNAIVLEANRCFNCGCVALNASDIAPALIALGADIKTTKRVIPAEKFFTVKEERTTVLADDEIISEIQVPQPLSGTKQTFIKFATRKSIAFAMVSVATSITISGGKVSDARVVLGAVAPVPYRAIDAENVLKGKAINASLAETAGAAAVKNTIPLSNNKHKVQIAKVLVKRAILGLAE